MDNFKDANQNKGDLQISMFQWANMHYRHIGGM